MGVVRKGILVARWQRSWARPRRVPEQARGREQGAVAQNRELQAKYGEAANQPKADPSQATKVNALQGEIAARDAKIAELRIAAPPADDRAARPIRSSPASRPASTRRRGT